MGVALVVVFGITACGDGGNPTFGGAGDFPVVRQNPPPVTGDPPPTTGDPPPTTGDPPPDDGGSPPPDDGEPPPDDETPPPDGGGSGGGATFTVGGTVSGLDGAQIRIRVNGAELTITADGDFTSAAAIADGAAYNVAIITQPGGLDRACAVDNGSGTVNGSNVTEVAITCGPTMSLAGSDPTEGSTQVLRGVTSHLRLSTELDDSTVSSATVSLVGPAGAEPIAVSMQDSRTIAIKSDRVLAVDAPYTLTISQGVRGLTRERLRAPVTLSFVTGHWESPQLVESAATNANSPQVAFDAQGNALAVWRLQIGGNAFIFTNRYTPGQGWGQAARIDNQTADSAEPAQLAVDPEGNAFAVWFATSAGRRNIWSSRYDVTQNAWSDAEILDNEESNFDLGLPSIAVDADGNALAVWGQPVAGVDSIRFRRYSVVDHTWGVADVVERDDVDPAVSPQIAMNANGDAQVIWLQPIGAIRNVMSSRYRPDGTWGPVEPVELEDGDTRQLRIALDTDGNAIAVWGQSDGAHSVLRANRYVAGAWTGAEPIEESDDADAQSPALAFDASGNCIVVWKKEAANLLEIRANRYVASEDQWGTAARIESRPDVTLGVPDIAVDSSGDAIAVWRSDINDGYQGIIATRYRVNVGWEDPIPVEEFGASSDVPRIALDLDGNGLGVWSGLTQGRFRIIANRFAK